jgi:hypothetical protein
LGFFCALTQVEDKQNSASKVKKKFFIDVN